MERYFKIDGIVETGNTVTHDEFLDKFIEFVESNGWFFGGITGPVDEDGNALKETIEDSAYDARIKRLEVLEETVDSLNIEKGSMFIPNTKDWVKFKLSTVVKDIVIESYLSDKHEDEAESVLAGWEQYVANRK